ncbi:MAG: T9SS type A sorting domain-containing protein [Flavobacteriales bacterium]|nr:T9SS type A sorting domain-containing protein [Flavobacteriales bacterium]
MRQLVIIPSLVLLTCAQAQVNGYARITNVSGTTFSLGAASEVGAPFQAGKQVVIMQMQDDVIGSNTGNNSSFGDLSNILQAGRYQVRNITSVSRDAFGAPVGMVVDAALTIPFNFGANSRLQAITLELLGGGGNFTTTAAITALPWNGDIGGVVAVQVQGTFTIAHSITADAVGFRGGARDVTNSGSCDLTTFISAVSDRYAWKGEGIYRNTNANWVAAKGKILNGGGGGNEHNGGGGGGGNYTAGGTAGPGWSCGSGSAGGLGGISLSGHIAADRIFMGGGGGGGEGNNNVSTNGGNGGGIILIKANTIRTTGTCTGLRISADGASVGNAGNDGGGGGGAGGSIIVHADQFQLGASCPLLVRANGGNGGRVNDGATHGAGGGGGQGAVVFSAMVPSSNITVETNNGAGGCNNSSNPCNSQALSASGSNGGGIIQGSSGPLPVELLSFQAIPVNARVALTWSTATELHNAFFTVERSADGEVWAGLQEVQGAGTSLHVNEYRVFDEHPLPGLSYYRLRQTDLDGTERSYPMVSVRIAASSDVLVAFPNPATDLVKLVHGAVVDDVSLLIVDASGRAVNIPMVNEGAYQLLDVSQLPAGQYMAVFEDGSTIRRARFVVQH